MRLLFYLLSLTFSLTLHSCEKCSSNQTDNHNQAEIDSTFIVEVVKNIDDTMVVWRNINLCDKYLTREERRDKQYSILQKKAALLGLIGEYKKAFSVQEKAVELLDSNNSKRLEFVAFKHYLEGDTNNYRITIKKAIENCGTIPDDRESTIHKSTLYLLIGDSLSARNVLQSYLQNHADSLVQDYLRDIAIYTNQLLEGRKTLVERLKEDVAYGK